MQFLALALVLGAVLSAQTPTTIPDGPMVWVGQHHYHLRPDCPDLAGAEATQMTLHQAILTLRTDCPKCKPMQRQDIAQYVTAYLHAISMEVSAAEDVKSTAIPKIGRADAEGILKTVNDDLADPKYTDAVKDVERSSFHVLFVTQAEKINRYFTGVPVFVAPSKDLMVSVIGPATFFSIAASEQLRKLQAVTVKWNDAVGVLVQPLTVQSPDIEQVVLRSNGATVEPISGALAPDIFTTMMGAKTVAHQGLLFYPTSAFSSDAKNVELMLIPKSGANTIHLFTIEELRRIQ